MPGIRPKIEVFEDDEALAQAAAERFLKEAERAVAERDAFRVALSGGRTPLKLFRRLRIDWRKAKRPELPWKKTHFFWGDERHVPPESLDNNYRAAYAVFLSRMPVPQDQIHRVLSEFPQAEKAAEAYSREIEACFSLGKGEWPRFDLVLLGMGADGHTASLFPQAPVLKETARLCVGYWARGANATRITLTPPVFNRARRVWFLVSGADKAETLKQVLEGEPRPENLPAQIIQPESGELVWMVDRAAAARLRPAA